jgi:hypothetical protein
VQGELSYSSWAAGTVSGALPPPKLLTEEEARAAQDQQHQVTATGLSSWNRAGTFEERDISAWTIAEAKALLRGTGASSLALLVCDGNSVERTVTVRVFGSQECGGGVGREFNSCYPVPL